MTTEAQLRSLVEEERRLWKLPDATDEESEAWIEVRQKLREFIMDNDCIQSLLNELTQLRAVASAGEQCLDEVDSSGRLTYQGVSNLRHALNALKRLCPNNSNPKA